MTDSAMPPPPREPTTGEIVPGSTDDFDPIDDLAERMLELERKFGRMTLWLVILTSVLGALATASLLIQVFHTTTVHVATAESRTQITTASVPTGTVGAPYSMALSATGGTPPYVWSVSSGSLPLGLVLSSTGVISGTPQASGTSTLTVKVTGQESSHGATQSLSITITQPTPIVTRVQPASGPGAGGTQVVISGSSLQAASSVMFGVSPATNYRANPSGRSIVAYAPAGSAGTVDITVTTPSGTSAASAADQYTFLAPSVTKVTPKTGPAGTSVAITGTNLNGATAVLFGGTPAASYVVSTTGSRITAVAPAGSSGPVDITVTTPGGDSATNPADVFTYP